MTPAVIWLIVGLVLVVAEVLSGEFVLLMLGGGALVAAGVSFAVGGVLPGAVAFAVASGVLVFAARPALRRRLERGIEHSTMHTKALVGATAVVVNRVDGHGGRGKVGGGVGAGRAGGGGGGGGPGGAGAR